MNKLLIVTILTIMLVGCIPMMPNQTNTTTKNMTETPEVTSEPETPEAPSEPETPEVPSEPETPEAPSEPETPEVPSEPETPKQEIPADIPKKEVTAGELVDFPNLKAVDPDGDKIIYTFSEPMNAEGKWQTTEEDVGNYIITITASDGTNTVSQQVAIIVNPKNRPPMIELNDVLEAKEGETFTLSPTITDIEGDEYEVIYSGWMNSNTKEIGYEEEGEYKVLVTAKDESGKTTKEITIKVLNTNRAPILNDITSQTLKEGEKVIVKPAAKDPDGDNVVYIYDFPLDDAGVWQTQIGDAGDYEIIVTATDGDLVSEKIFALTVTPVNRPPVIDIGDTITIKEGEPVQLSPVISDAEGDEVKVTYSGWMNSNSKQTTYEDQGNYKVTIIARDSAGNEARKEVMIIVEDVNRAPVFGADSFI